MKKNIVVSLNKILEMANKIKYFYIQSKELDI